MIFRPYYYFDLGCAAYLFGCGTLGRCAVVDPRADDVDAYPAFAASKGMRITHVVDTHVHADHRLIVGGMWVQAVGIGMTVVAASFAQFAAGGMLLGVGTAMVYPTLLAAIGDVAEPSWRATAVGVYRLWRDLGYAVGAALAGMAADVVGISGAMWLVALVTAVSGVATAVRMRETRRRPAAS